MKTFKQFLSETSDKTIDFAELLKTDCVNFFKQSQRKGLLFRGVSGYGAHQGGIKIGDQYFDYYKKSVRKGRKPTGTSRALSQAIDDWFEEEMGMRARSEAVFCYGEKAREAAASYGLKSVMLPIGKFIYCWSPDVEDLYETLTELDVEDEDGRISRDYKDYNGKIDKDKVDELMKSLNYTINGFDKACAAHHEIMIECDEYYVIPYKDEDELGLIKKAFVEA